MLISFLFNACKECVQSECDHRSEKNMNTVSIVKVVINMYTTPRQNKI